MNTTITSLLTLAGLGAFHGLNPGMGWLFAVALGMQEGKRSAVWRAMIPLTLGHLLAIAAAIGVAMLAGIALSPTMLRWPVAALLAVLGVRQLYRHLHPRWAAMRVGMGGLTLWSFLMASAHGAGLMVLPVFLSMTALAQGPACHARGASTQALTAGMATLVHSVGYLIVTAFAAWVVMDRLGLGLLRKAWINLDLIWAVALILTGGLTALV
ncbi:MAG TPA: hypothetical protein VFA33_19960 [Bryobacteraceae bacterium]|nr:hypothetical protein [Bryobacteraceae bacterium]